MAALSFPEINPVVAHLFSALSSAIRTYESLAQSGAAISSATAALIYDQIDQPQQINTVAKQTIYETPQGDSHQVRILLVPVSRKLVSEIDVSIVAL